MYFNSENFFEKGEKFYFSQKYINFPFSLYAVFYVLNILYRFSIKFSFCVAKFPFYVALSSRFLFIKSHEKCALSIKICALSIKITGTEYVFSRPIKFCFFLSRLIFRIMWHQIRNFIILNGIFFVPNYIQNYICRHSIIFVLHARHMMPILV